MKKLRIGEWVKVDGPANQWPFERIVDVGEVIDQCRHGGYIVKLEVHRENLFFRRRDLTSQPKCAI